MEKSHLAHKETNMGTERSLCLQHQQAAYLYHIELIQGLQETVLSQGKFLYNQRQQSI